jgi:KaiC/GvpD/RAD55 family RecA-like ATPase
MGKPKVFISYSHLDEPWKDRLVKHLGIAQKQGLLQTWNDRDLLGGDDWFAEIINAIERGSVAVLLVSHNSLTSNFILNEEVPRMLARREVKAARFYPIVVEDCDWEAVEWLKQFNLRPCDGRPVGLNKDGVRTEEQINRDLKEVAKEIRQLLTVEPAALPMPEPLAGECPYLGLEAFTEDTQHLFFGRDDFADALFDKVKRQNFVVLVGPSGSGKSSVVQADLFPRLRRDTQMWATILFPPREDPFLSLAAGFVWRWQPQANYAVNTNEAKKLAAELKDAQRLIEAIQRTAAASDGRLLLVIDQFEEMFTLCAESDRRAFLDVLLAVKDAAPVTVMLTLRADFMGQAQSFSPAFSQLLDDGIVSHRPLTRADLEAVITGPARYAGLEFEPGLVNLILQEVAGQPDSLPLLEYALKEMWRQKGPSRVFDYALYEAVGKVEGAISQHADAVLSALPEAEQALALRALTRLVRVAGEEGEADTRLRLPLGELPEAWRAVLQTFVTARLLVTKREEGAGAETIEVAHEALIRRWEKLREALDGDREFLMWRRRLDSRRKAWEQKGRDDKWLLYGGEREDAQRWLNEGGAELTAAEIEFITWDDRPDFQIERILSESLSLSLSSGDEIRKSWFATLVFCREKEKTLSIAREIEAGGYSTRALSSVAEALAKAGMATEALAAARGIEAGVGDHVKA